MKRKVLLLILCVLLCLPFGSLTAFADSGTDDDLTAAVDCLISYTSGATSTNVSVLLYKRLTVERLDQEYINMCGPFTLIVTEQTAGEIMRRTLGSDEFVFTLDKPGEYDISVYDREGIPQGVGLPYDRSPAHVSVISANGEGSPAVFDLQMIDETVRPMVESAVSYYNVEYASLPEEERIDRTAQRLLADWFLTGDGNPGMLHFLEENLSLYEGGKYIAIMEYVRSDENYSRIAETYFPEQYPDYDVAVLAGLEEFWNGMLWQALDEGESEYRAADGTIYALTKSSAPAEEEPKSAGQQPSVSMTEIAEQQPPVNIAQSAEQQPSAAMTESAFPTAAVVIAVVIAVIGTVVFAMQKRSKAKM